MNKLTREGFDKAREFLMEQGRLVDRRLFEFEFEGGTAEGVVEALEGYAIGDGGFGKGLEPDLRLGGASVLATTVGFQVLRKVGVKEDEALVVRGIEYLLGEYDAEAKVWPIIPANANEAPAAPWWDVAKSAETFGGFLVNPRAEVLGYLYEYGGLVPDGLLQEVTDAIVAHLAALPDKMDLNDFQCLLRLAETRQVPEAVKGPVLEVLQRAAPLTVAADPAAWGGHACRPLWVVSGPEALLAGVVGEELLALNLDYEIEQQAADGAWEPCWSWFGAYPETWPQAERDWRSQITQTTLTKLRAFGRIEGI